MIRALRVASWSGACGSLEPAVAVFRTQSVRTTGAGRPSVYDACKRAKDRKRHFAFEVERSSIEVNAHPAGAQGWDNTRIITVMPQLVPTRTPSAWRFPNSKRASADAHPVLAERGFD